MISEHDRELLERLRAGTTSTRVPADDPVAVARTLAEEPDTMLVEAADLGKLLHAASEAEHRLARLAGRVRQADEVVAGAVAFEQARAARVAAPPDPGPDDPSVETDDELDGPAADQQAIRFALVILVLAQLGGIAVFVAERDLVAVLVPAAALVALALVVAFHHRPVHGVPAAAGPVSEPEPSVPPVPDPAISPAVRAAEAHLRRQQAAWKVAWWDRRMPAPAIEVWEQRAPLVLVSVDRHGDLDEGMYATMTAGLPAAIRVVVLVPGR